MTRPTYLLRAAALVPALAGTCAAADTLLLRDGTLLEGTFVAGGRDTLRFQLGADVRSYAVGDVLALNFDARPESSASAAPAETGRLVIVARDTPLGVRLPEGYAATGEFEGRLAEDLRAAAVVVAPAGSPVYGHAVPGIGLELTAIRIGEARRPVRASASAPTAGPLVEFRLAAPFTVRLASP